MATAGAIIGLAVEGLKVENIETTSKTMPDFPAMWADMLSQKSSVAGAADTQTPDQAGGVA